MRSRKKVNYALDNRKVAILAFVFIVLALLLIYQKNVVNNLDKTVSNLENQYNEIVAQNDELSGKLLAATDLKDIEQHAKAMGMVSPKASQITYVAYNTNPSNSGTQTASMGALSEFLHSLFH